MFGSQRNDHSKFNEVKGVVFFFCLREAASAITISLVSKGGIKGLLFVELHIISESTELLATKSIKYQK